MENTLSWLVSGPFMYLAVIVFVVATLRKVVLVASMPRHLRWDLYPIAHEGPAGSIFQKVDHSSQPRTVSLVHELAEMAEEILLLKRTFLYNRKMWNFSYPMHLGFYFGSGWIALIALGALIETGTGVKISGQSTIPWLLGLHYLTVLTGAATLVLGLVGTLGLLFIRLTDEELKDFTAPVTLFNLYLITGIFGVGLAAWLFADPGFVLAREYFVSLLTFKPAALPHPLMVLEAFLVGVFLIYLPFSRMLHFAAKYFFYHNIMWDDEPVTAGGNLEKSIAGYLHYKVEWSAAHIVENGSWLDQATTNPTAEVKKANETQSKDQRHSQTGGSNFSA